MAESKGWYATCPEAATPPPTEWRRWDDLPHRLFFAHSSPTWDGGGVAFVDFGEDLRGESRESRESNRKSNRNRSRRRGLPQRAERRGTSALGVTYRLYRVTLEQFNDVLAQENGMPPGDAACREMTAEEARRLADAWTALVPETARVDGAAHAGCLAAEEAAEAFGFFSKRRPARRDARAPSERWYGYVKCIGALHGEPVLTFSCDADQMRAFRSGANAPNAPSAAYYEVIRKGLAQSGSTDADAGRRTSTRARRVGKRRGDE